MWDKGHTQSAREQQLGRRQLFSRHVHPSVFDWRRGSERGKKKEERNGGLIVGELISLTRSVCTEQGSDLETPRSPAAAAAFFAAIAIPSGAAGRTATMKAFQGRRAAARVRDIKTRIAERSSHRKHGIGPTNLSPTRTKGRCAYKSAVLLQCISLFRPPFVRIGGSGTLTHWRLAFILMVGCVFALQGFSVVQCS